MWICRELFVLFYDINQNNQANVTEQIFFAYSISTVIALDLTPKVFILSFVLDFGRYLIFIDDST